MYLARGRARAKIKRVPALISVPWPIATLIQTFSISKISLAHPSWILFHNPSSVSYYDCFYGIFLTKVTTCRCNLSYDELRKFLHLYNLHYTIQCVTVRLATMSFLLKQDCLVLEVRWIMTNCSVSTMHDQLPPNSSRASCICALWYCWPADIIFLAIWSPLLKVDFF